MHSEETRIGLQDVTKSYRLFGHPGDRVKQFLSLGLKQYHRRHDALKGASFDIRKGEAVGIIGRNGSGKSTLLQLICGILKATSGEISVRGRISALLELGAGFNPEFTGRENVYFQSALYGLTRAMMDERFDDIASFADIGEFLDQPVRTYSSGMFVRLAFAAMIHTDADILVIDEALAVGDAAFQRRCFDRLASFLDGSDKILLFVSHQLHHVDRLCSRVIWLNDGRIVMDGDAGRVCSAYLDRVQSDEFSSQGESIPQSNIECSGEIDVTSIKIVRDGFVPQSNTVEQHSSFGLVLDFVCNSTNLEFEVIIGLYSTESILVASARTLVDGEFIKTDLGQHQLDFNFLKFPLAAGIYHVRVAFRDKHFRPVWVGHRQLTLLVESPHETNPLRSPAGLVSIPFSWHLAPTKQRVIPQVE